jgi:non-specific serine/threonine protein kinase
VESSYQLLPPALQRLLLRLSVFRGGWQEEMATVACFPATTCSPADEESELAEGLRILREHSLITVHEAGERMRYGMLETLRTYGQEMLTAEEADRVQARHAAWFLKFAQEAAGQLRGPEQVYWLNRLEQEQDNLRGALEYGVAQDPDLGLRLANALYWFWYVRGYFRAGEQWLTELLERAPDAPPSERAWGLLAAGHLANCQSNNGAAVARYEAARALFEQLQDETGVAHTLCRLGNAAQEMLDLTTADRLCAESIARFRTLNDPFGLMVALFYYANVLEALRSEQTSACFEEALTLAEAQGDLRFQALLQHCLCNLRRLCGDIAGAVRLCRTAAQLQFFVRDPLPLSYMLRELSALAMIRNDYPLAGRLYGTMHGLRQRLGYPISPHESVMLNELEAEIRAGLSDAAYGQAFGAGQKLDFEACLLLARETAENL